MDRNTGSRLKSAILALAMLTFAAVVLFEGVAIGEELPNAEDPVLDISKTMISGDLTVPKKTLVYWQLQIDVSYADSTDLTNVIVKDTLPAELVLINTTVTTGSTSTADKKGATKITWDIGTMSPGDSETLTMWISTAETPGQGAGKGKPKYHFSSAGEYSLNNGATVEGVHASGEIEAGPTDEITVFAINKQGGHS